ncbi:MAG: biotin transporter BioY [Selenomonas sp.]|uniref:biotin transporter BioY n=1 Tax=Selenomonas sp. TaxID=2053611 RepID=UPI0025EAEBCD|nr:biotin transporter BioY [Selenomonas sp.]MCR5756820.1 biotin transporter BioY [Selenomonas sp.]
MKKLSARELSLCGMFIALITAGTFIRIPVGTDVYTLQFLFTLLAGLVLGAKLGAAAVGGYVLLGLLGVPVFASGGGLAYVLQPTFGYLLGFILQAYLCGVFARKLGRVTLGNLLKVNLLGMAVVYLIGISYFYIFSNYVIDAPISLWWAVFYCGILQVFPDFLLCLAAAGLGARSYRAGLWVMNASEQHGKIAEEM